MPLFCSKTALFGGFEGGFSYKTDKSALACPDKTEVADFVRLRVQSFKELIYKIMLFFMKYGDIIKLKKEERIMDTYAREILNLLKNRYLNLFGDHAFSNVSEMQSYWLQNYEDNLIHPMDKTVQEAYEKGAGKEISSGKIGALKSSSALTYNLFWNQCANITSNKYSIGIGRYAVEFEKRYRTLRTSNFPAHLDAFLYSEETKEAVACEMKMTEWIFNSPGNLRVSYLDANNYVDAYAGEIFSDTARKFIGRPICGKNGEVIEYNSNFQNYDAFQMFKHTVALYRMCMERDCDIRKLTLLNCAWTLSTPDVISDIVSRQKYTATWNTEINEFDRFTIEMHPIKELFHSELGIDFEIRMCTFAELLGMIEKEPEELAYLARYFI